MKIISSNGKMDSNWGLAGTPYGTNISIYKQIITKEDINTGHQVSYSACENDSFDFEARYSCCFVQLPSDSTPAFGRISFSHTFANNINILLVYPFSTPRQDLESKLWWVSRSSEAELHSYFASVGSFCPFS